MVLTTPACSIDLAQTTWDPYTGVSLRISAPTSTPKQIIASYWYRVCDEYCNNEYGTATVGFWTPGAGLAGARLASPPPGSTLSSSSVAFSWNAVAGASSYCLRLGSSYGAVNYANNVCTAGTSVTVSGIAATGTAVYGSITTYFANDPPETNYFEVTAKDDSREARIVFPVSGTQLSGTSFSLQWAAGVNVNSYRILAGTSLGFANLLEMTAPASQTSAVVVLPSTLVAPYVYVTVQSILSTGVAEQKATYRWTSTLPAGPSAILSPAPGSILSGSSVVFSWSPAAVSGNDRAEYFLAVGRTPGGADFYPANSNNPFWGAVTLSTTQTVPFPVSPGGRPVYVSLYSRTCSSTECKAFQLNTYRYETPNGPPITGPDPARARLIAPTPSPGLVAGRPVSFTWDDGVGVDDYWLTVGTTPGGTDIFYSYNGRRRVELGGRSVTVDAVPHGVSQLHVTLYSLIGGAWYPSSQIYPVATLGQSGAIPQSFYDCIDRSKNGSAPTCQLPAGTFFIDPNQTATGTSINPRLSITKSNITVAGATAPGVTRLVRKRGCDPLVTVGPPNQNVAGVTGVKVENLIIDGNNEALANSPGCMTVTSEGIQPGLAVDMRIEGPSNQSVSPTSVIRVEHIEFEDAVGRSLSIEAPGVKDVSIYESHFYNSALTGLLLYGPNIPNTVAACDATSAQVEALNWNRPRNVTLTGSLSIGNWTGAIANNSGYNFSIVGGQFISNYIDPYDGAGGTVFYDMCSIQSSVTDASFTNEGVSTSTEALEIHGRGLKITGNTIAGYPSSGITLNSASDIEITGNQIYNNGSVGDSANSEWKAGIGVMRRWSCLAWIANSQQTNPAECIAWAAGREVKNLTVSGNSIYNRPGYPGKDTQTVGIRFRRPPGRGTLNDLTDKAVNVFFGPNTLWPPWDGAGAPERGWCFEPNVPPGPAAAPPGNQLINIDTHQCP